MKPIRELTRKEVPWNWSNERERAFQNVKKRLTEAPILVYFDTNKEIVLQVDSSKNGIGAVMDSASFSICTQFLSDCRSAREANSTSFQSCSKTAPIPFLLLSTCKTISLDDKKVNAIREMPTPTDVAGVKRLCGMVQYMAKFFPISRTRWGLS
jgi:hypothetical protein